MPRIPPQLGTRRSKENHAFHAMSLGPSVSLARIRLSGEGLGGAMQRRRARAFDGCLGSCG
jgi:hypothetical protein